MENKNLEGQLNFDSQLDGADEGADNSSKQHTEEFEIGKPAEKDNLVFEVNKAKKEDKNEAEPEEPIVQEFIMGATPEVVDKKESAEPQKAKTAFSAIDPPKRRGVYVPRFTEASDKYRKMIDTRTFSSAKDSKYSPKDEGASEYDSHYADATSEREYAPTNQVHVNVTSAEPESDALNVFKFAGETPVEEIPEVTAAPEIPQFSAVPVTQEPETEPEYDYESAFEEELKSIEKLIATDDSEKADEPEETFFDAPPAFEEIVPFEKTAEESVEVAAEEAVADVPSEETFAEPVDSYILPDPVNQVHIEEYVDNSSKVKEEPVPDCVVKDEPSDDKKGVSEFTHQTQRDSFKDRFLDSLMAIKIRLGAIGIFSIVLLVFELLAANGVIKANVFKSSSFDGTLAAFDLLFAGCVFVLAMPEIIRAVKHLTAGKLLPEISIFAGFLVLSLYCAMVMLFPEAGYPLYGFIFAISALSSVFSTYYRTSGDFTAFKQVSQNSVKKVLDVKLTRELDDENVALDGLVDEYSSKTARIYRTAFVTDFFKRAAEPIVNNLRVAIMIGVPFAAAVVTTIICAFIPGGVVSAFAAFALVFLAGCPAFAILTNKISYFDSQEATLEEDGTVIGEKAYSDFSEVDVIAFEDTEIFGTDDVKLKRFMLYGDRDNIEKAMRQMYSIFSAVGGPLYSVFANALDNRVRHAPATDVEIETDGISGMISGSRIYAGNDEYMRRHGIPLPSLSSQSEFGIDTTKILYAAEGGEVYAKFYIRYSFSEEFTMLLPEIKSAGLVPLIYTNDPNLSNELLKTLSAGADCMRVVKKFEPRVDAGKTYRRATAGVVTYGDKVNAINTILLTRKYKEFSDKVNIAELYAMSIAAAAGVLMSVLGVALPSLVFGLWHIAWCVGLRLVSRKFFLPEKN